MNLDQSWKIAELERDNFRLRAENRRLEIELENVRDICAMYHDKSDLFCGKCDADLGSLRAGYAEEYRFCPYCGVKLDGWEEL